MELTDAPRKSHDSVSDPGEAAAVLNRQPVAAAKEGAIGYLGNNLQTVGDGSGMVEYDSAGAPPPGSEQLFTVVGTDCQVVQIPLQAGQVVTCEPGAMCNMSDGVTVSTAMGGLMGGFSRGFSGESLFLNEYTNAAQAPGYIGITPSFPGQVIPIHLPSVGGQMICKRGCYMGHLGARGACNVAVTLTRRLSAGCVGGLGFFLQSVTGQGWAFLNAGGTIVQKVLQPGESIRVDTRSVVAFTANVDYDVATSGDCAVMCCGGEGIFNAKFTATNSPGLVLVQSMSLEKLKALFARPRPPPQDNSPAGLAGEAQGLV